MAKTQKSNKAGPQVGKADPVSLADAASAVETSGFLTESDTERAVLVSVEITGERRRLSRVAQQARTAASLDADDDQPPVSTSDLDFEAALAEFHELARSAGAEIVATVVQRRGKPDAATLIGPGKVDELVGVVASSGANLVLFDHELTPSQLRNLDDELPCRVIDRTQLILDIFARHARTREGHLQVELAQLEYQLPRLAGKGKAMSQTGGGIGTRGPGETKLETDRRRIRARIDRLKLQLETVRRNRNQQRQRREAVPVPTVALVGYTNAGKSTLFNALTAAGVEESSRMFATLDPKLRQLTLPSRRKVLLSDTVGFIRNLPHTLVTSFRATLEEVERAELLLHVRDASSPMLDEQKSQVEKVLAELNVSRTPTLQVLNKIDLLPEKERLEALAFPSADIIAVSAHAGEGLQALIAAIEERIGGAEATDPTATANFRIPQREGRTLAALEGGAFLEGKRFEGNLILFTAHGPTSLLQRYRRFMVREHSLVPQTAPEQRPRYRTQRQQPDKQTGTDA
ncbi:MAG: GTPase HflX [Janthinobacterium lividum]